jgi:hypothetical protein
VTRKLTEKQRRFAEAFMGPAAGNATEAARLAGYAGSSAVLAQVGAENLRKPEISAAIAAKRREDPLVWGREELQRFWSEVAQGKDPGGGEAPPWPARLEASKLLGKSQAIFVERVKHEGSVELKSDPRDELAEKLQALAKKRSAAG